MNNNDAKFPVPVVQRLSKYLAHIHWLRENNVEWTSSQELADALGLTSSTVRQDLMHLDFSGLSKRGYETNLMESELCRILGADKKHNVAVIGAGNLGKALVFHQGFSKNGFFIRGIYDNDLKVIGTMVGELAVRQMRNLPRDVVGLNITMGIIAVPAAAAQQAADMLIISGVRGILNMALAHIIVPRSVHAVDARIIASLQELVYMAGLQNGLAGNDFNT